MYVQIRSQFPFYIHEYVCFFMRVIDDIPNNQSSTHAVVYSQPFDKESNTVQQHNIYAWFDRVGGRLRDCFWKSSRVVEIGRALIRVALGVFGSLVCSAAHTDVLCWETVLALLLIARR